MAKKRKKKKNAGLSPKAKMAMMFLGGLLLVALIFAWITTRPETGEKEQAVCVLVVDRTGSSNDPKTVAIYKRRAESAVEGCRKKQASMSIYYFEQTSQKLILVSDKPFPLWLPTGRKPAVQKQELEETIAEANESLATVFAKPPVAVRGSDILTALNAASENLYNRGTEDGIDQLYLIMLTDGVQTSGSINVESFGDASVTVDSLVEAARANGLIPETLEGVQVSFIGVNSGLDPSGAETANAVAAKTEDFWRKIVAGGGGQTCTYVVDSEVIPVSC